MSKINPPCVPEGLRDIMKNLTKEMLKKKPSNIYEFSANYFESINEETIFKQRNFEITPNYETIIKNSNVSLQTQIPISLIYGIIPEELIVLIKEFIKAVLRSSPDNICEFAVQYFNNLQEKYYSTNRLVEYASYENYLKTTQRFSFNAVEKCSCGRILTQSRRKEKTASEFDSSNESTEISRLDLLTLNQTNNQQLKTVKIESKNISKILCVSNKYFQRNYLSAIVIIQRYFRRILKKRRNEKKFHKGKAIKAESYKNKVSTELVSKVYRETKPTHNECLGDTSFTTANDEDGSSADKEDVYTLDKNKTNSESISDENKNQSVPIDDTREAFTPEVKNETASDSIDYITEISKIPTNEDSRTNLINKEDVTKDNDDVFRDISAHKKDVTTLHNKKKNFESVSDENKNPSVPIDDAREVCSPKVKNETSSDSVDDITEISKTTTGGEYRTNLVHKEDVTKNNDDSFRNIPAHKEDVTTLHKNKTNSESVSKEKKHQSVPIDDAREAVSPEVKNETASDSVDIIEISKISMDGERRTNLIHKEHLTKINEDVFRDISAHKKDVTALDNNKTNLESVSDENKNSSVPIDETREAFTIEVKNETASDSLDDITEISKTTIGGESHTNLVHKEDVTKNNDDAFRKISAHKEDVTTLHKNKTNSESVSKEKKHQSVPIDDAREAVTPEVKNETASDSVDIIEISKISMDGERRTNLIHKEHLTKINDDVFRDISAHKKDVSTLDKSKTNSESISDEIKNQFIPIDDAREVFTHEVKNETASDSIDDITEISKTTTGGESRTNLVNKEDVTKNNDDSFRNISAHKEDVTTLDKNKTNSESISDENKHQPVPIDYALEAFTPEVKNETASESIYDITKISETTTSKESRTNLVNKEDVTKNYDDSFRNILAHKEDVTRLDKNKTSSESVSKENKNKSVPIDYTREVFTPEVKNEASTDSVDDITEISKKSMDGEPRTNLINKEDVTIDNGDVFRDIPAHKKDVTALDNNKTNLGSVIDEKKHPSVPIDETREAFTIEVKNDTASDSLDDITEISKTTMGGESHTNLVHKEDVTKNNVDAFRKISAHKEDITTLHKNKTNSESVSKEKKYQSSPIDNAREAVTPEVKNETASDSVDIIEISKISMDGERPTNLIHKEHLTKINDDSFRNISAHKEDVTTLDKNKTNSKSVSNEKKHQSVPIDDALEAFTPEVKNETASDSVDDITEISKISMDGESRTNFIHKEDATKTNDDVFHDISAHKNYVTTLGKTKNISESVSNEKKNQSIPHEAFTPEVKNETASDSVDDINEISKISTDGESRTNFIHKEDATKTNDDVFLDISAHKNYVTTLGKTKNISESVSNEKKHQSVPLEAFTPEVKNETTSDYVDDITEISKISMDGKSRTDLIHKEDETKNIDDSFRNVTAYKEDVTTLDKNKTNSESVSKENKNQSVPIRYAREVFTPEVKNETTTDSVELSKTTTDGKSCTNLIHKEDVTKSNDDVFRDISAHKIYVTTLGKNKNISELVSNEKKHQSVPIDDALEAFTPEVKNETASDSIDDITKISKTSTNEESRTNLINKDDVTKGKDDVFRDISAHKEDVITLDKNKSNSKSVSDAIENQPVQIDDARETYTPEVKNETETDSFDDITEISETTTDGDSRTNLVHKEDVTKHNENANHSDLNEDVKEVTSGIKNEIDGKHVAGINVIFKPVTQESSPNSGAHKENLTTMYVNKNYSVEIGGENKSNPKPIGNINEDFPAANKNENRFVLVDGKIHISNSISDAALLKNFYHEESVTKDHEYTNHSIRIGDAKEDITSRFGNELQCEPVVCITGISKTAEEEASWNNVAHKEDLITSYMIRNHYETIGCENKNSPKPIDNIKDVFTASTKHETECGSVEGISDMPHSLTHGTSHAYLVHKEDVILIYENKNDSAPINDLIEAQAVKSEIKKEIESEDVATHSNVIKDVKEQLTSGIKKYIECGPVVCLTCVTARSEEVSQQELLNEDDEWRTIESEKDFGMHLDMNHREAVELQSVVTSQKQGQHKDEVNAVDAGEEWKEHKADCSTTSNRNIDIQTSYGRCYRRKNFEICNDRNKSKPQNKDDALIRYYNIERPVNERFAEIHLKSFRRDITIPWYLNDVFLEEISHYEDSNNKCMKDIETISGSYHINNTLLINGIVGDEREEIDFSDSLEERNFEKDSLEINSPKETDVDEDSLEISSVIEDKSSERLKNIAEERMATYFYGVHIPSKNIVQTQPPYKKSTAFIIPFESDEPIYLCKNGNSNDNLSNISHNTGCPEDLLEKIKDSTMIKKNTNNSTEKTEAFDLYSIFKRVPTLRDIVRLYLSKTNRTRIPCNSNSTDRKQTELLASEYMDTIIEVNEGDIKENNENNPENCFSSENESDLSSSWATSKESEELIPREEFEDIFESSTTNLNNYAATSTEHQGGIYEICSSEICLTYGEFPYLTDKDKSGNKKLCDGSYTAKENKLNWFVGTEPIETSVELYKNDTPLGFTALSTNQSMISSYNVIVPTLEDSVSTTNVTAAVTLSMDESQREVHQVSNHVFTGLDNSGETVLLDNEDGKPELLTSIETRVPFEHLQEFAMEQGSISIKEQEKNDNNGVNSFFQVPKTDEIVEQMQQQLLYKENSFDLDNNKERKYFEEHAISLLENLLESKQSTPDSEDEMIVVNHTDNDETRGSSALSDFLIIGQMSYEEFDNALKPDIPDSLLEHEISQYDLLQSHKSNNIKDHSSLHLDEITAENIRLKMLASSLSEAEPRISKADMWNQNNTHNRGTKLWSSNVSTTLTDTNGTSTDTDTTIIVDTTKLPKENEILEIATALPDHVGINEMDQDEAAARRMAFQRDEQQNICKRKSDFYAKEYILKWLSRRQNSMPVQIDSEIFRVIPKHMRKRIKSAEGCKTHNQEFQD
ncbi:MATH and LRR domain-containing protein PFE0570w isoform X2 [Zeugodacus cucurbitae]|uniref:MATH and LRR domain-containing protein PFE0570w isoform X2 n=1 Tax=Zeugodacus cucurbitae TaxID=28588 RepID=UPI0023D96A6D|nr:MATH and LRR domain-containing protein PFE0570w isoform X2 [Zeugodacus cucurbitae]